MLVLLIVLAVTNIATLAAFGWYALRPREQPVFDLEAFRGPAVSTSAQQWLITIEILNPLELARTRGRMAGLAGSLAPSFVRRVVYDQAVRTVKRQLAGEGVIADVRLHSRL